MLHDDIIVRPQTEWNPSLHSLLFMSVWEEIPGLAGDTTAQAPFAILRG